MNKLILLKVNLLRFRKKQRLKISHQLKANNISTTYIDSDGNIRSINEIEYDIGSDKFEITSNTYTFNKDGNPTMLDLFNKILA